MYGWGESFVEAEGNSCVMSNKLQIDCPMRTERQSFIYQFGKCCFVYVKFRTSDQCVRASQVQDRLARRASDFSGEISNAEWSSGRYLALRRYKSWPRLPALCP